MTYKTISILVIGLLLWGSCSSKKQTNETEAAEEYDDSAAIISAICMGNNVSVRSTPSAKGDRLTALAIGEEVAWLDSTAIDSEGKVPYEYAWIQLSDGTKGWAVSSYLFSDASLSVVFRASQVFTRPDLLTPTDKYFQPLDLVAFKGMGSAEEAASDWVEVTGRISGEKSFTTGWILDGSITANESDVLVGQLAYKANELKGKKRMEALKELASSSEFQHSGLISHVKALTYWDSDGFLKPELEKYYVGMINMYDSIGYDDFYFFNEMSGTLNILGKSFGSMRYGDWRENNHFHIWNLFHQFSGYATASDGKEYEKIYNRYYQMKDKIQAVETIAGVSVYSRYTEEYGDFSRVNPVFIRWVSNNLLPHPDNDFLGVSIQKIYDAVFQENARYTYKQWRAIAEIYDLDNLAISYEEGMHQDEFSGFYFLKNVFDHSNLDPVLAGMFVRRKIDGSYDAVVNTMQKALTLYDGVWYTETKNADSSMFFPVDESEYIGDYEEEEDYYEEEYVEEQE